MIKEVIGIIVGTAMIKSGDKDFKKSCELERKAATSTSYLSEDYFLKKEEGADYRASSFIKEAAGIFITAGCTLSLIGELSGCTKSDFED